MHEQDTFKDKQQRGYIGGRVWEVAESSGRMLSVSILFSGLLGHLSNQKRGEGQCAETGKVHGHPVQTGLQP